MRRLINARELGRRYQLDGPRRTVEHLTEALRNGDLSHNDFSIKQLAYGLVKDGREWVDSGLVPNMQEFADVLTKAFVESAT